MKQYKYEVFNEHGPILSGMTSGKGTRKEQKEEIILQMLHNGINYYRSEDVHIHMHLVDERSVYAL